MTEQEIKNDIKGTINWLLENGDFKDAETSYNIAMNSINILDEALIIHGVVVNEAMPLNEMPIEDIPDPYWQEYINGKEKSEVKLFCYMCQSTHVYQPEPESIKCYSCGFYGAK